MKYLIIFSIMQKFLEFKVDKMLYTKKDLLRDINFIPDEDVQNVKIFKNGYLFSENIISGAGLKKSFNSLDFSFDGGVGLIEFYIILGDDYYTFKIVENVFEFDEILQF